MPQGHFRQGAAHNKSPPAPVHTRLPCLSPAAAPSLGPLSRSRSQVARRGSPQPARAAATLLRRLRGERASTPHAQSRPGVSSRACALSSSPPSSLSPARRFFVLLLPEGSPRSGNSGGEQSEDLTLGQSAHQQPWQNAVARSFR